MIGIKPATNLEERWGYDYAVDTGDSAVCPECGSTEVGIFAHPDGTWSYDCYGCGHTETGK